MVYKAYKAVIYTYFLKKYKLTMPVNEKILFRSFQYLLSPKSIIYAICRRQCCAKITLFFWGKNIDFQGGGGNKYPFSTKI